MNQNEILVVVSRMIRNETIPRKCHPTFHSKGRIDRFQLCSLCTYCIICLRCHPLELLLQPSVDQKKSKNLQTMTISEKLRLMKNAKEGLSNLGRKEYKYKPVCFRKVRIHK